MDLVASSNGLLYIAAELVILIFAKLDLGTLVSCKRVCRHMKVIIDDSVVLQYKIELAVAGMEDGPPSAISVTERLQRLKNHMESWKTMSFSPTVETVMLTGNLWELYGGVLGLSERDKPSTLVFRKLRGIARGVEGKQWTIEDVGFPIRDFKMDPSQDLLVMLELLPEPPVGGFVPCRIHFRSLTGNEVHPFARNPVIVISIPAPNNDVLAFNIQFCRDRLGIMFEYSPADDRRGDMDIIVYNWRTATVLFRMYGINSPIEAYTFLSEEYILLGIAEGCSPRLEVYKLSEHSTAGRREWNGLDYFCAFVYEKALYPVLWSSMSIQGEPSPSWSQARDEDIPFFTSPSRRVLGVMFDTGPDEDSEQVQSTKHLIPLPKLLPLVSLLPEKVGMTYVWPDWASDTVLNVPQLNPSTIWCYWIHGTKVLHSFVQRKVVRSTMKRFFWADVLDLNPIRLKRESARRGTIGGNGSHAEQFTQYKAIAIPPTMGEMIDEDNIILVEDQLSEEEAYDVKLFLYLKERLQHLERK